VGDCWLLAFAEAANARLVTFDQALYDFARKQGNAAIRPA
jgi:predicted nucleic acid-binding protein